jgi:predicted nucleotidyltransferase
MYNLNMQKVDYRRFLPEITRRILAVSDPEKIILFGSYAREDNITDSDLDLLVVMKQVESPRSESIRLRQALRGLLVPVDVIVVTTEQMDRYGKTSGLIYQTAQTEGKLVYERPIAG